MRAHPLLPTLLFVTLLTLHATPVLAQGGTDGHVSPWDLPDPGPSAAAEGWPDSPGAWPLDPEAVTEAFGGGSDPDASAGSPLDNLQKFRLRDLGSFLGGGGPTAGSWPGTGTSTGSGLPGLPPGQDAVVQQGVSDWMQIHAEILQQIHDLAASDREEDRLRALELRAELIHAVTAPYFAELGVDPSRAQDPDAAQQLLGELMQRLQGGSGASSPLDP